ncbi:MAG: hypothetical protein JWN30_1113 [Bacilli bacterium]|nr:hypothetical protein [Bacilli bacterium]
MGLIKKHRQLIAGIVIGSLVAGGGAVFADSAVQAIQSSSISIKFDGVKKQFTDGYVVLTYQDHTYVPARFVAEALGANVNWDDSTSTVLVSSNGHSVSNGARVVPLDVSVTSGPMNMHISKVTLDPAYQIDKYSTPINAVVFTVQVENTSTSTVSWHPAQGTIVLNTKEQADAGATLFYSDQVDGEFIGQVVKSGNIAIKVNSDLTQIKDIKFKVPGAFNDQFNALGNDALIDIPLN